MYCSKCAQPLPDDAAFCYKCAQPTIQIQPPPQVQPLIIAPPRTEKPHTVVVRSSSGLGAAFFTVFLLAVGLICAGVGYLLYQQEHEYFGFRITDKGISISSDGSKNSRNYPTTSSNRSPGYSYSTNTQSQMPSNSSGSNNVITCEIVNIRKTVNAHENCDTQDCDTDETTATYTMEKGDEVTLAGYKVESSLASVGSWIAISVDGKILYIAETKLSCE